MPFQHFLWRENNAEKQNDPICDDNTLSCDSVFSVFTNHNNINQDVNADDLNCENLISAETRKLKQQLVKMKTTHTKSSVRFESARNGHKNFSLALFEGRIFSRTRLFVTIATV